VDLLHANADRSDTLLFIPYTFSLFALIPSEVRGALAVKKTLSARDLQIAQQTIYQFLLEIVKKWPPEEVLLEFKRLFLYHVDSMNSEAVNALYEIVFHDNEVEFRNTIKRACYILVNNWDANRRTKPIQDLISSFQDENLPRSTISPTLTRLRIWVRNFQQSQDYRDLKLFADRYTATELDATDVSAGPWVKRYTSYLLVPQYVDTRNPIEQREAARALAQQLREKFKFDLAMYVARSQSGITSDRILKNPTELGDNTLRLIKTIVAKRGTYSYGNLANIFLNQIQNLSYVDFKQSLQKYLIFSVEASDFSVALQARLSDKLDALYEDHHRDRVTPALILRTCNRMIEFLTTEQDKEPSALFVLLLSQGSPMTLVVTLLKLMLISKNSRTHLEARIADLLRYYEEMPEQDCKWVVNFLEIFNVTFTIYADNVQYNLIQMQARPSEGLVARDHLSDTAMQLGDSSDSNLDTYRVFSQLRRLVLEEPEALEEPEETLILEEPEPQRMSDPEAFPV
jgi:hypothetical protein